MWDGLLCWPPSPYNAVALLPCPPHSSRHRSRTIHRRCTSEGGWEIAEASSASSTSEGGGPSHYTPHPCLQNHEGSGQGLQSDEGVITELRVDSKIEQRYAQTMVTSTMKNTNSHRPSELKFKMTLPKTAFISSLIMEIDGVNFTSNVRRKSIANRSYQLAKERGKDAALVSIHSGVQEFEVSANVVSYQVTFYLKYEELLRRVNGQYVQKIHIAPGYRIPEAEVNIHICEREPINDYRILELPGQELAGNPGAKVSEALLNEGEIKVNYKHLDPPNGLGKGVDGTFTIAYNLRNHVDGGQIQRVGNYFTHFLSLDANERLPKMPTHTVFALDVSNSMGDGKLKHLKEAMRAILNSMSASDSFEILPFSSDVATLGVFNGTHLRKALRRVRKLQPIGYSNLNAAYLQALRSAETYTKTDMSAKQIVMITDGGATAGVLEPSSIRRNVHEANKNRYPIYGLAFGVNADFNLIRQISADSEAFARQLVGNNLAKGVEEFYKEISKPILTNVAISYPENEVDPSSVVKIANFNFYSGGEVVAVGRVLPGVTNIHPWITGVGKVGPMQLQMDRLDSWSMTSSSETESSVIRLWAYLMIQHLLAQAEMSNNYPEVQRLLDQATQLALRFSFVTHVTSLVVRDTTGEHEADFPETDFLQHLPFPHSSHELQADAPQPPRIQRYHPATQGYVDLDPHFVVYSSGISLPFCFDLHAKDGAFLSLIRDEESGITVNGETMSSVARPKLTYITKLFLVLGQVNITITPEYMEVDCIGDDGNLQVDRVTKSLWPFYKKNGRKYRRMAASYRTRTTGTLIGPSSHKQGNIGDLAANQRQSNDNLWSHKYNTYQRTDSPNSQNIGGHNMHTYPVKSLADEDQSNAVHYVMNSIVDDYIPHRNFKRFISRRSRSRANRHMSRHSVNKRESQNDHGLCSFNSTWKDGAGKKYGNVMVILKSKKNLHITIGDGEAHFAVVRSQKDGQRFLGFYLEGQNVLSPKAHGIIGQFANKNITISPSTPISSSKNNSTIELLVKRRNRRKKYRVTRVLGLLSKRRSVLGKEHVECIQVNRQGKGLLDGRPRDYLLNCLQC